jgi:hypothetical protein
MSLTSIMRGGFSKEVVKSIPIPKVTLISSSECLACPKTKNYALIGTAFDYLLRSEIKHTCPTAKEQMFVADASIRKASLQVLSELVPDKGHTIIDRNSHEIIGIKELDSMECVSKKYHKERDKFIADGILTDDFIETTIRFAKIDTVFRERIYFDVNADIDPLDIEDMRNLYDLIPADLKAFHSDIVLNPTFEKASRAVGGADADFIADGFLIDIKTTKIMQIKNDYWSQIVGYLILEDEFNNSENKTHNLNGVGLYFSRYGRLWTIDADYIYNNPNYKEVKAKLFDLGNKLYPNE